MSTRSAFRLRFHVSSKEIADLKQQIELGSNVLAHTHQSIKLFDDLSSPTTQDQMCVIRNLVSFIDETDTNDLLLSINYIHKALTILPLIEFKASETFIKAFYSLIFTAGLGLNLEKQTPGTGREALESVIKQLTTIAPSIAADHATEVEHLFEGIREKDPAKIELALENMFALIGEQFQQQLLEHMAQSEENSERLVGLFSTDSSSHLAEQDTALEQKLVPIHAIKPVRTNFMFSTTHFLKPMLFRPFTFHSSPLDCIPVPQAALIGPLPEKNDDDGTIVTYKGPRL